MRKYFTFLHLKFDVLKAQEIAASKKFERRQPKLDWISPTFVVKRNYVPKANLFKPVIFASLPQCGQVCEYLIDGNHAVTRAVEDGISFLNVVVLNVPDSLAILCSTKSVKNAIEQEAKELGLIDDKPKDGIDGQAENPDDSGQAGS